MMCYKDRTFCQFYSVCSNGTNCDRALTPAVQEAAVQWWGEANPPIAMFIAPPAECFVPMTENASEPK